MGSRTGTGTHAPATAWTVGPRPWGTAFRVCRVGGRGAALASQRRRPALLVVPWQACRSAVVRRGDVAGPAAQDGRVDVQQAGRAFQPGDLDDTGLGLDQSGVSVAGFGGGPLVGALGGLDALEGGGLGALGLDQPLAGGREGRDGGHGLTP